MQPDQLDLRDRPVALLDLPEQLDPLAPREQRVLLVQQVQAQRGLSGLLALKERLVRPDPLGPPEE